MTTIIPTVHIPVFVNNNSDSSNNSSDVSSLPMNSTTMSNNSSSAHVDKKVKKQENMKPIVLPSLPKSSTNLNHKNGDTLSQQNHNDTNIFASEDEDLLNEIWDLYLTEIQQKKQAKQQSYASLFVNSSDFINDSLDSDHQKKEKNKKKSRSIKTKKGKQKKTKQQNKTAKVWNNTTKSIFIWIGVVFPRGYGRSTARMQRIESSYQNDRGWLWGKISKLLVCPL
ncbi:hypothetical protein RFI_13787 [Reticulomyxa filosa]|uniref:Uncharacterized protein n=1 Tax=Reticulomyxa filosa TaxID=46433 RepID=X6NBN8_RETFI|nr:hypothetical protein RFI_13787 [Reticulomyxa filosa]|eukprot:ETO23391.1 hypothetical protein RFI_13787 [Reticulomyxa filosa]